MKFEYSDFYKFIASLGIALISLAVLVPWLFLREPFDLLLKSDDIIKLTPLAQSIIGQRQSLIEAIIKIIPWFSPIVFGFGLVTFIFGGRMWLNKTQRQIDKLSELNVKLLEQQLVLKTPEESKADKEEEVMAMLEDEDGALIEVEDILQQDEVGNVVRSAYRIEKMVADRLKDCFEDSYKVLSERRLNMASFDIILLARTEKLHDYTIEVKYIRKGFKYNWLRDNVQKSILANQIYQKELERVSIPVLLVIIPQSMTDTTREIYLQRIEKDMANLNVKHLTILRTETELFKLSCSELKLLFEI
jgi:hypothetical protein